MSIKTITIETRVAATPDQVWGCWTAPEHITQWNLSLIHISEPTRPY